MKKLTFLMACVVVIYPQVEVHRHAPIFGTDLYSTTTYKVTARMGKLKQ